MNTMNTGALYLGGRSLSIGGPTNLLPDTPQNIIDSGQYNKSIAIMTGVNKHDGSWVATGKVPALLSAHTKNIFQFQCRTNFSIA